MRIALAIALIALVASGCAGTGQPIVTPPGQNNTNNTPNTPMKPANFCMTAADCMTGGCSGQLCIAKTNADGGITTCEWREEYSCYKPEGCGCVENRCAWSAETLRCIEEKQARV